MCASPSTCGRSRRWRRRGRPWTAPLTGIEFVWVPPGKYEITQGQWHRVMGSNPSYFQYAGDRAPVENVNYQGANNFVAQLNSFAKGTGLRYLLPTEAQWEYACRAGSSSALYNGPLTIKGAYHGPELDEIAWYGGVATGSVVSNTYVKFGTNVVNLFVWDGKGEGVSTSVVVTVTRGANRLPVAWDVAKEPDGTVKTNYTQEATINILVVPR